MQALGMKPVLLLVQVLLESTYLVLFGTLAGAALGVGAIATLGNGLDLGSLGVGASMFGASERLYPEVHVGQIALSCAVVIGALHCRQSVPRPGSSTAGPDQTYSRERRHKGEMTVAVIECHRPQEDLPQWER